MDKLVALASVALLFAAINVTRAEDPKSPLDFKVTNIDGKEVNLADYKGKVVLMVNVASHCGNTHQYKGMEDLYKKYHDKGFVVLGFPANEFAAQEPGTNAEIAEFCKTNYSVDFPMFSKIVVKGEKIAPLYDFLTSPKTDPQHAGAIKWNFEKFLIGRNGQVAGRFEPKAEPESPAIVKAIEGELEKK